MKILTKKLPDVLYYRIMGGKKSFLPEEMLYVISITIVTIFIFIGIDALLYYLISFFI